MYEDASLWRIEKAKDEGRGLIDDARSYNIDGPHDRPLLLTVPSHPFSSIRFIKEEKL